MTEQVPAGGDGEAPQIDDDEAMRRRIEDDEEAELDEAEVEGGTGGVER